MNFKEQKNFAFNSKYSVISVYSVAKEFFTTSVGYPNLKDLSNKAGRG